MRLCTERFYESHDLTVFVNVRSIPQSSIQAIVCEEDGTFHLFYWGY